MVRLDSVVWATAAGIAFVAIAKNTNLIQDVVTSLKTKQPTGWLSRRRGYGYGFAPQEDIPLGPDLRPLTKEQAQYLRQAGHPPFQTRPLHGEIPQAIMPTIAPPTERQVRRTQQREERQKRRRQQQQTDGEQSPQQQHRPSHPSPPPSTPFPPNIVPALAGECFCPCQCPPGVPSPCFCPCSCHPGQPEWSTPSYQQTQIPEPPGRGTTLPQHQPQIGPIQPLPHRQPEIGPTVPLPRRQPQIGPVTPTMPTQGREVGRSRPAMGTYTSRRRHVTETIDANGCYLGDRANDEMFTCRAGIGTNPGKHPTYEAGRMTTPVSDLLGGSRNFHLTYHFHLGQRGERGTGGTTEVTAGYDGSNKAATATGITIGIRNGNGAVMARTEDHNSQHKVPGEYRELCREGTSDCGGVAYIPEFSAQNGGAYGKEFDITWVGSQIPGGVNYKGYLNVGNKVYKIVDIDNPRTGGKRGAGGHAIGGGSIINYATQDNYFARGRSDAAGSARITGILFADGDGTYDPGPNVITGGSNRGGWDYIPMYSDELGYYEMIMPT